MVCMIALWALISLFLLVVPRSTISNLEKRTLAEWPKFSFSSYFSGEYTAAITNFYDDTVPFRDTFKNISSNILSHKGIKSDNTVEVVGVVQRVNTNSEEEGSAAQEAAVTSSTQQSEVQSEAAQTETEVQAEAAKQSDGQSESSADETKGAADGELSEGFLIINYQGHWRGLPLFGGNDTDSYAGVVNRLHANLGDDVTIYVMPVPLASAFYLPSNFADYSGDQTSYINELLSKLDDGIVRVNVVDALSAHQDEDIYLRTDHHWTQLGAYYAVEQFAKAAGVPYPAYDSAAYTRGENDGYVGSLYGYTQSSNLLNDPETFVYYSPTIASQADYYYTNFDYNYTYQLMMATDVNNSYMMFIGGDDQIVKVTNAAGTGRKLAVIKDSYGNAEIPWLTSSFDEIYVIDMRYFDVNLIKFIQQQGITDVLFSADTASVAGGYVDNINTMMDQAQDEPIIDSAPAANLSKNSAASE